MVLGSPAPPAECRAPGPPGRLSFRLVDRDTGADPYCPRFPPRKPETRVLALALLRSVALASIHYVHPDFTYPDGAPNEVRDAMCSMDHKTQH